MADFDISTPFRSTRPVLARPGLPAWWIMPDTDLCFGMAAIAAHLGLKVSAARNLADKGVLPTFRIDGVSRICARRSTLTAWLAEQEAKAAQTSKDAA